MDEALSLAAALRRYRQAAGLSQEAVAERSGLSVDAVSAIERGLRRPRAETVRTLSVALGLSPVQSGALLASLRSSGRARKRAVPPGLPAAASPLVGREHDLAVAGYLLSTAGIRLLTLTGAGGVGKTRLALEVAGTVAHAYPDGVTWVDLAPLHDHGLVAARIAQQLGLREHGTTPVWNDVLELLRAKRALLVLDNFEHLFGARSLVQMLLDAGPRLAIVVTSRAALGLRGEQEYVVAPLALPEAEATTPEAIAQSAAVTLFLQRARAVLPTLRLTITTAPQVAEICRRLDGVPLAIELAAALATVLAPGAMLQQLGEARAFRMPRGATLDLLTAGSWDWPDRQQTMRAAIAWSHDLLTADEQSVFRRLGVFSGGWDEPGAVAVAGRDACGDMRSVLDGLVAKHLIRPEERAGGTPRLGMLETIREYAVERLEAAGETSRLRDAHLAHYAALATLSIDELRGPDQAAWMSRLEDELDNVRAALEWARQSGQVAVGLRLATAMTKFWDRKSYLREGRAWLEGLLALPGSLETPEGAAGAQAVGTLAYRQGEHGVAAEWLRRSQELYRTRGDEGRALDAASMLANVYLLQGEYGQAVALYEQALAGFRAGDQRWYVASTLNNLGEALRAQGDFTRAATCYQESLAVYREIGDLWSVASVLNNLGELAFQQGEDERAAALSLESLELNRRLGERQSTAAIHRNLGNVAARRGDLPTAKSHYLESLTAYRRRGYSGGIAGCLDGLARIAAAEGRPEGSARLFGAAAALRNASGEPLPLSERAAYELSVAALRGALAPATFQAAWAAGSALDVEAAVALALEGHAGE